MSDRLIAVIDGNSLLHRAFHAVQSPMNTPDGTPTNAVFGFMQMLLKMIEDYNPDAIVCAWDVHRPDWRMKLLERYKAQRPPMDESLAVQFPLIRGLLEALNIPNISMDGFEGDDILGTMAARGEENGDRVFLITGDKDAYQLVTDKTSVVTTRKGMSDVVIYTPAKVEERYGITPAQVTDYLGLKGDTSDNIPGVPGVGEKTAAKLLNEYGSLDKVLENAGEIKGKMGERLREHAEDALISREVATIRRDAPIELSLDEVHFPSFDAKVVTEAFGALHFNRHLRSVLELLERAENPSEPEKPVIKLSYHMSKDAERFVKAAIAGERSIAIAIDEPAEQTLFDNESFIVFSDGAGLARVPLEESKGLIGLILEKGKLVGIDLKNILSEVFKPGDPALELGYIYEADLFDCSLAAYLLDSNGSYTPPELALKYLGLTKPEGTSAPSTGQFEAAVAEALKEPLAALLEEDGSWKVYTEIELPLMPVLLDMERYGVDVDTSVLQELSADIEGQLKELSFKIYEIAGEEFNIDSPKQLGHILFDVLGLDTKKSKKNRNGWSTSAAVLEKLAEDHELPVMVIEYRELSKLKSTYLDKLPTYLEQSPDGRIHTKFNQTITTTGRLSSSDPNLQNIPVRTEIGRRIREAFVAPEGGVFVSADYSQIELRLLACLSGDEGLVDAFLSGEDFHAHTASDVFGVEPEDVTPDMRTKAKAVNFGIVYGQQAFGLGQTLQIPTAEAQEMIDRYYGAYPKVRKFLDDVVAQATENGYATTMFGRKRHIPELVSTNVNLRHFGERTAMNHPLQGMAADIIKLAMIRVAKRLREEDMGAHMVLQVHDELDFECPKEREEELSKMVVEVMDHVADLCVPLVTDVGVGPNWAAAH